MLKPLKSALTATMLSAVAITPVATVSFLATADVAVAKGKKEKSDRGSRGNKGNKGQGGKPTWLQEKSKGGSKGGNGKAKKFAASEEAADCPEGAEDCVPELRTLHASELGNMNGALHANENAILAHIRNGNTNGPVGHMAALAIAGYDLETAQTLINSPIGQDYADLDAAAAGATVIDADGNEITFENYEDYLDYLDAGGEPIASIEGAEDNFGSNSLDAAAQSITDADGNSLYGSYAEYLAAVDAGTQEEDVNVLAAESVAANGYDATTAENLDTSIEGAQADYDGALAAMQEYWNKGGADSENADDLAAMLEARIDGYENVGATIEEQRAEEMADTAGDEVVCEEGDADCATDETALLDE